MNEELQVHMHVDYLIHIHVHGSSFHTSQRAVRKVLPKEELEKNYVIEACLKECSTLLSSFRTEERRRVHEFTV